MFAAEVLSLGQPSERILAVNSHSSIMSVSGLAGRLTGRLVLALAEFCKSFSADNNLLKCDIKDVVFQ